jgi:CheY-like chemotaxis protein
MTFKVLVIDDDIAIRKSFLLALEDSGYQVDTAEDGLAGIEMFTRDGHDLIFLDLKMPGINGVETLQRIREHDGQVPVYIVTAFHQEFLEELQICSERGVAFELLRKPIRGDQIEALCQSVLTGAVAAS